MAGEAAAHFYAEGRIDLAREAALRSPERGAPQGIHGHRAGADCDDDCSILELDGTERRLLPPMKVVRVGPEIPNHLAEIWATEIAPDPPSRAAVG